MALGQRLDEAPQHVQHVLQCLPGHGLGEEDHEIDRVPLVERHAHFGVLLETADTGAMTGARIDDHYWRPGLVEAVVQKVLADPGDAQQGVIGRALQPAAVQDHLIVEVEQRWLAGLLMLKHVVGTLAQGVQVEHTAPPKVGLVGEQFRHRVARGGGVFVGRGYRAGRLVYR